MCVMWALLRNRPQDVGLPPIEQYHGEPESLIDEGERLDSAPEGSWQLIGKVLSSPMIWTLAIAYFPIKLARYSFTLWGPLYVQESLGTTGFPSALTAAWMPIGGVVGVVASGYISDKMFQSRPAPVTVLSLIAAAAVMLLGLLRIDEIWMMRAFFFLAGLFLYGPDSMVSATAAIDFGTKRRRAAVGFINGVGSFGAVLGGFLPSVLTSKADWTVFFQISLAGLIVSALILLMVEEAADRGPINASALQRHDELSLNNRKEVIQLCQLERAVGESLARAEWRCPCRRRRGE